MMKNTILLLLSLIVMTTVLGQNDQAGPYSQTVYFSPSEGLQGSVTIRYGYKACYDQILMVIGWSNLQINSYRRNGKKYFAADLGLANFQGEVIGMSSITASTYNRSTKRSYGSARGTQVQRNFTLGCFGETIFITPKDTFSDNITSLDSEFSNVDISYNGSLSFKADNYEKAKENKIQYDQALRRIRNESSNERKLQLISEAYGYTTDNSELNRLRDQIKRQIDIDRQKQTTEDTSGLSDESVYLEVESYGQDNNTVSTSSSSGGAYSPKPPPESNDGMAYYNRLQAETNLALRQSQLEYQQNLQKAQAITDLAVGTYNMIDNMVQQRRAEKLRYQQNEERKRNKEQKELSTLRQSVVDFRQEVVSMAERYADGAIGYETLLEKINKYVSKINGLSNLRLDYSENRKFISYNDDTYLNQLYQYIVETEFKNPSASQFKKYLVLNKTRTIWLSKSYNREDQREYLDFISQYLSKEDQVYKRNLIAQASHPSYVVAILRAQVDVNDSKFYKNWMTKEGQVKRFIEQEYQGATIIMNEEITEKRNLFLASHLLTGLLGFVDRDENWKIEPTYEMAYPFFNNTAIVTSDYKPNGGTHYNKIDINNNILGGTKSNKVLLISPFEKGYARAVKQGNVLYGLVDRNFNWQIAPKYLKIEVKGENIELTNRNYNTKTLNINEL